jgi:predicted ATP-dependent endonuclease of OLD family
MKIKKLILENLRIFKERTTIDFDNLTAFIGKNDIGKSTILEALDIFLNDKDARVKIDKDDLSKGANSSDILIGVVFEDLPKELIIDATVQTDLKEEYLLNKDGNLEIHKIYSNGKLKSTFILANHQNSPRLKDLLSLKISELKTRAQDLGIDLSEEDKRVSSKIRKAIRENINEEIKLEEISIFVDKEGAKQIWEQLKNYMPLYALFQSDRQNVDQDSEVQDPMKIAIKKILRGEELQNKLKGIQEEVETTITGIANQTIEKLNEMNPEIAQELKPEIPEPKWENVFKGITISSDEGIPLNKRGSGVRRLILLNFFRAEAEKKKEERNVPNIIYAFEEPETSQHPEHQRKLIEAFLELSSRDDTQIILSTHSPGIASLLPIESLRFLYKRDGRILIEKGTDEIFEKISESIGVLPSIDKEKIGELKLIVCVEGPTDVEFFKRLSKKVDEDIIIDLEKDQGVVLIPLGGSTLKHWVDNHYLRKLSLPEIHIYDGDKEEYKQTARQVNSRDDGSRGFTTQKREIENYVHPSIIEQIFHELNHNTLIDITQDNWIEQWNQLDIIPSIKTNGVSLRKIKIKEKICTKGIENMTVKLFQELQAYEEIKEWFRAMKNNILD